MIRKLSHVTLTLLILWIFLESSVALAHTAKVDGPNCINNALVESKIINFHRYSSLSEINLIINSKLCQKVASNDTSSKAIGLIYSEAASAQKDIISHAFIRLNGELAQEKHGWSMSEPYQITELQKIFNEYEVSQPQKSVVFYHCQSWSEFLKKSKIAANTIELLEQLFLIEKKLNSLLNQESASPDELDGMVKMIVSFSKNVLKSSLNEDLFIKRIIASRVVSISNQLEILGHNSIHSKTFRWEFSTDSIEDVFEALAN